MRAAKCAVDENCASATHQIDCPVARRIIEREQARREQKMAQQESKPEQQGTNFTELAENMDEFREVVRVMVAGMVDEGFTDREARAIVAGLFGSMIGGVSRNDDEEGSA